MAYGSVVFGIGFGSGRGSRALGLAWPWLEGAAYARRLSCRGRSARRGGRRERVGAGCAP